jgi:flavorubredoxin
VGDAPTTLVPDRLYALGGTVPLDGRVSWFPAEARGIAPLNCYLLVEDGSALLIDTGPPAHREVVLEHLGGLLPPGAGLSILHTRIAEYDSVGNTAAVCAAFPVERLYAHFPANLMLVSTAGAEPPAPLARAEEVVAQVGDAIPLNGGGRELVLLGAPLRLLLTFWAYDTGTRTLFTSDSFGHVPLEGSAPGPDEVRDHLYAKFDWLTGADRRPLADELDVLFQRHDVETIAPMHGRPLSGRDTVARHVELVGRALEGG